jgi:hypothetical protein
LTIQYDALEFLNGKGELIAEGAELGQISEISAGVYEFVVDTYAGFELPPFFDARFADGTTRRYATDWRWHTLSPAQIFEQGTTVIMYTVLSAQFDLRVTLHIRIVPRVLTGITFNNFTGAMFDTGLRAAFTPATNTISITGITITAQGAAQAIGNALALVEHLLSDITLTFAGGHTHRREGSARLAASMDLSIFDTQRILATGGQNILIRLAQGSTGLALHDVTVNIRASQGRTVLNPSVLTGSVSLVPYSPTGGVQWPSGYSVNNLLPISVHFSGDASATVFNAASGLIWRVVDSTVAGFGAGQQFTGLTANQVLQGGSITIYTHLRDSTRLERTINVASLSLATALFSSPTDGSYTGRLPIVNNVVRITDLYSLYPLHLSVTSDLLPRAIVFTDYGVRYSSPLPGPNMWTITMPLLTLQAIGRNGLEGQHELARATVLGVQIILYIEVAANIVNGIEYAGFKTGHAGDDANVPSATAFVLYFDAYHNASHRGTFYNGSFELPVDLIITFADDPNFPPDMRHVLRNPVYRFGGNQIRYIPYDLGGSLLGCPVGGRRGVLLDVTLGLEGQSFQIFIFFYDKTILQTHVARGTNLPAASFEIDPYGDDISVPRRVALKFDPIIGGADVLIPNVTWRYPQHFAINYLGGTFRLTSELSSATYGSVAFQEFWFDLEVRERIIYGIGGLTMTGSYNSNDPFFIQNPWSTMVSDLPSAVLSAPGAPFATGLRIVWDLLDRDIAATGTMSTNQAGIYTGRLVRGYLHNRNVGQEVTLRLFVDRWTFQNIREQRGEDNWVLMSPVNFFFSRINERSQQGLYQVTFRVERIQPSLDRRDTVLETVMLPFIPEDIAPSAHNYILYWDSHARNSARAGGQHTGSIFLGNPRKTHLGVPNIAIYQYEAPNVSQLAFGWDSDNPADHGYGFGRSGLAILAVCPLNPVIPDTAKARGRLNQDPDAYLGLVGVRVLGEVSAERFARFIGGGIWADFEVIITVFDDFSNLAGRRVVFEQAVRIRLVFLDRSLPPLCTPLGQDPLTLSERYNQVFRTTFAPADYPQGTLNPYGTDDPQIFAALNKFVAEQPVTFAHFLNITFAPNATNGQLGSVVSAVSFTVVITLAGVPVNINYGDAGFNPIVNPMRIKIVLNDCDCGRGCF